MNIYQKLIKVRVELQDMQLKKSGKNQSIAYYELGDFLPAVVKLCEKHDLLTRFNIISDSVEKAVLTLYNATEPKEKIDFITPTAEVELPRGQKIQNLGAKITYLRRYMLMTAFEIVESDLVDSINREMTDEISNDDLERINKAKTQQDLIKVCSILKTKYKTSLITPHYDRRVEELKQNEVEDQSKGTK
jgi:hypothetical protein